jgi:azurin
MVAAGVADDRHLVGVGLVVGAAVEGVDAAAVLEADPLEQALGADGVGADLADDLLHVDSGRRLACTGIAGTGAR